MCWIRLSSRLLAVATFRPGAKGAPACAADNDGISTCQARDRTAKSPGEDPASGKPFPAHYSDGPFVAFHGSWNRSREEQTGYNGTFQPFTKGKPSGDFEVFASGLQSRTPLMRPNDAVARPDGSLYITDSQKGKIWRVVYQGQRKYMADVR